MNLNPTYLHEKEVSPEEVIAFREKYLRLNEDIQKALTKGNHAPIGDGPIDCEGYLNARIKILWLMKEPYDTQKGERMEDVKTGGWYFSRDFFENKKFGPDRTTWYPIINASHAILTGQTVWDQKNRMAVANGSLNKALYHISYVNVQKLASPTREQTDNSSIYAAFEENKGWLQLQFELLNPDVIIGANTLNGNIFEYFELKGKMIHSTRTNEAYFTNGKIFIRAKHPAQRRMRQEDYINDILSAVQAWKQKASNKTS